MKVKHRDKRITTRSSSGQFTSSVLDVGVCPTCDSLLLPRFTEGRFPMRDGFEPCSACHGTTPDDQESR